MKKGLFGILATSVCLLLFNQAKAATQYEAENATLSGNAKKNTNHSGYSGASFVDGFYNSTNALVSFTVSAPTAGSATVTLRYSAGNGTSTNTGLYINGSKIKNITCNSTSNWDTWSNQTETVTLNAGNNTINYKAEFSASACINLDYISVQTSNPTYTVSYNGNGNTSGTVPVDVNSYVQGTTVTVANTGTLARTGYTFAGWNTAVNGSGTARAAGSTFAMGTANVTLYAQWTSNPTYTVAYNGNGNTSGTAPVDANYYVQGAVVTVANVGSLSKTGYTFAGWNTAANGSGTSRAAGSTFTMGTSSVTLYAVWTANTTLTLSVTSDGHGTTSPSSSILVNGGSSTQISAIAANGYQFSHWSVVSGTANFASASNATTTVTTPGGDVTVRAIFTALPATNAVTFAEITSPVPVNSANTVILALPITAPSAGFITVMVTGLYGTSQSYTGEQRGLESFVTLNSTSGGTLSGFVDKPVVQNAAMYVNETAGFQVAAGSNTVRLIVTPRTTLTTTTYQFVKCKMTVVFSQQKL